MSDRKNIVFDAAPSARATDENGFLHVGASHITKAAVNPYHGREIPGWREAGLNPDAVYHGLRDPQELQASLETWAGLPLHIEHHVDSADAPEKLTRVGAVGAAAWNAPYVDAPLTVWDRAAIEAIEDGSFRELSCAYRYDPDFTPGTHEGVAYDFVMRNIRGNHVALVEEGRAGPDVVVADSRLTATKHKGNFMGRARKWFQGAQDDAQKREKQDGEPAGAVIGQGRADPVAEETADIAARDDATEEIRRIIDEASARLDPEEIGRLAEALADLARSPVADADADDPAAARDRAFRRPGPRPLTALDAARVRAVRASAIAEAQEHMRGLHRAVRDVRGLVGDLDPLGFDAASDVYAYALEQRGVNPRNYPRQAWRGMVDILRSHTAAIPGPLARDAAPARLSGSFAGLSHITIAE